MVAQPGIEQGQVLQTNAFATQCQGETSIVKAGLWPYQVNAGAIQLGFEGVGADAVQHGDGGHVQGIDQRFLG